MPTSCEVNLSPGKSAITKNGVVRLFCFPPCGSGSSFFRQWVGRKSSWIDLWPVELPGRERRAFTRPCLQLNELVENIVDELVFDRPFAFFGHSLGALIGFELCRLLRRSKMRMPLGLFVSAAPAPQLPLRPPRYQLPQSELIEQLRLLGGTPERVLSDPSLLEYFLPIIRADFSLVDTYSYQKEEPLSCPIYAFRGDNDQEVDRVGLEAWSMQTTGLFQFQSFPGDHFYTPVSWMRLVRKISNEAYHLSQESELTECEA